MSLYQINNFLLILILLFNISSCSGIKRLEYEHQQGPDIQPPEGKPDDMPDNPDINPPRRKDPSEKDKETDTTKEESKIKEDYDEQLKENLLLKEQIENKLKYIKILLITGGIMLLIIIIILFKIFLDKKKTKKNKKDTELVELQNSGKNKINLNNSIENSNFNLLNSELAQSNSVSISFNSQNHSNISNVDKSKINEDNRNNLSSVKKEEFNIENVNDDYKTLTNNPDIFIPSRTDKILYQPYSNEEIYNNDKK